MVRRALVGLGLALAAGCGDGEPDVAVYDGPPLPWAYAPFPTPVDPADNPSTPEKVELGRLLFYDPILSADQATACATCHSEVWGMSDGLPRSVGVHGTGPTGPGRTGPNVTERNAQTLWNVAFRGELFWDGREASLEAQALRPLEEPGELGLPPAQAIAALATVPAYLTLFAAAFPKETPALSETTLARALAAFQRSLVSARAPYDQYVAGDAGALGEQELLGMRSFGEAGCAGCHAPPLFESDVYAARGLGSGDPGRQAITGLPEHAGAMRTPSLRNVRESDPYFHDGSAVKLRDAVAHEVAREVASGRSRGMSEDEVDAITTFLNKALTDRSLEPSRPKSVPSGLPVPKDGFRIPR